MEDLSAQEAALFITLLARAQLKHTRNTAAQQADRHVARAIELLKTDLTPHVLETGVLDRHSVPVRRLLERLGIEISEQRRHAVSIEVRHGSSCAKWNWDAPYETTPCTCGAESRHEAAMRAAEEALRTSAP